MLQRYAFLVFFLLNQTFILAQNFVYVNYSTQQGLANPVVYKVLQDKNGFLWFATETGVSRFDGSKFVNFTTKDGLPSNEIINIFEDSKGRIWFLPFKNTICYYYQGKIYSPANDSVLAKIKFKSNVWQVSEDGNQRIFLTENYSIHIIHPHNEVTKFDHPTTHGISFSGINNKKTFEFYAFYYPDKNLRKVGQKTERKADRYVFENGQFALIEKIDFNFVDRFFYKTYTISPKWLCQMISNDTLSITNFKAQKTNKIRLPNFDFLSYDFMDDDNNTIFFNTRQGSWEYNFDTNKFVRQYLPDKNVCHITKDLEGNLWFCTLGQGIYKLATNNAYSLSYKEFNNQDPAVFCLSFVKDKLIAGGNNGNLYEINDINTKPKITPHKIVQQLNRITTLLNLDANNIVLQGFVELLQINATSLKVVNIYQNIFISTIKEFALKNKNCLLAATATGVLKIQIPNLSSISNIFKERSTCIAYHQDTTYIGTIKGLYIQISNDSVQYLGNIHPLLKERISKIVFAPRGQVWVATYDYGLIALKNLKPTQVLNEEKGLTSNFCRTMFVDNNILWVGTAKGLNRVNLSNNPFKITQFSQSTGLISNVINALMVKNDTVYVGTPEGITYFADNQSINYSVCKLHLLDVKVNNQSKPFMQGLELKRRENNLKISFTAISYRSEGDITYYYRVKGLQEEWQTTRQTELLFPSLPSGEYVFELKAINKFGVESALIRLPIYIQTPFWQSTWFYGLIAISLTILGWQITRFLSTRKSKQELTKLTLARKIADLEQTAVKAQMEPHFIFNCLTSIQNLVLKNSPEQAYSYMNKFARLIRQTLEYSSQTFITVAEEIEYLENYLALGQLQMAYQFEFQITFDQNLAIEIETIPVMLLQPYVENALKHAFWDNNTTAPKIYIHFAKINDLMKCEIEDNGMGRAKSIASKAHLPNKHQSKGMELVQKRIETLRLLYGNNILIEIEDKQLPASGTLVRFSFA
jgi:ligand-binding sensor domain-containing protein/two-component sensor histidine kinase